MVVGEGGGGIVGGAKVGAVNEVAGLAVCLEGGPMYDARLGRRRYRA